MRLLVTRPAQDGEALAARLREMGHEPVLAPVMEIVPRQNAALSLEGVQAVLITSRNGARALAAATTRRDLPVYAVGDSSAGDAKAAGFAEVFSASGDVGTLTALVERVLKPTAGALLHVVGTEQAGDLAGALGVKGFAVPRAVLYESRPAAQLPETARNALQKGLVQGVLFYSPRTARLFGTLVESAGLGPALEPLTAYCLSEAIAAVATSARYRDCPIAATPNEGALLALLKA
jgi:uroporphyrinogen-III synthase